MARERDEKEKVRTFTAGEKVFAKVKGYRAWPAYIEREEKLAKSRVKYHVIFYHTNEKACCKPEDIYPYGLFKDKYGKQTKVPSFNRALELIEKDAPDLSKFSLAEKLSAARADVEEIKKNTKRALGEAGVEETNKSTKKLILDETEIEETTVNTKKRTPDADAQESQISSSAPEDDSGSSEIENNPKRQKVISESPQKSSPEKSGDTSDNIVPSDKDGVQAQEKEEPECSNESGHQKRKLSQKKKLSETPTFRPKTAFGEDPAIHLKKIQLLKKAKERLKGGNEKKKGAAKKGTTNMSKQKPKKDGKKTEKLVKNKGTSKGKKLTLSKEDERTTVETESEESATSEKNTNQQGSKQRTREQYDVSSFAKGDHVFARVKGYPPWPAIVTGSVVDRKKKRYLVAFYASLQKGVCPAEHLFPYQLYKQQYGYLRIKNAALNRALDLIEKASRLKIKGRNSKGTGPRSISAKNLKNNCLNGDISSNESTASGGDKTSVEPPADARGRQKKVVATDH